ncbi:MAG TPA: PHP domain-containing protein [Tissierellia bacterium]|nr:PHP domain-containing protein [Tissierellia bacterium]
MRISADYHTHTTYSDGRTSHEDNVRQAIKLGLKTIGIADHAWGHAFYGIKKDKLREIKQEIDRLKERFPEIRILLSIEANILGRSGQLDVTEEEMALFDVVQAGYHFGSKPSSFDDIVSHLINYLNRLFGLFKKTAIKRNTTALINAMKRYPFHILTHPGDKGPVDIVAVAEAAIKYNKLLEINQRHHYLTVEQLRLIRDMDVKLIIGSDAHRLEDIGQVADCIQRVIDAGIDPVKVVNLRTI